MILSQQKLHCQASQQALCLVNLSPHAPGCSGTAGFQGAPKESQAEPQPALISDQMLLTNDIKKCNNTKQTSYLASQHIQFNKKKEEVEENVNQGQPDFEVVKG